MKVAHILKLRNDVDIVKHTFHYYHNIGITDFFVMLHLPSIELLKILKDIIKELSDSNFRLLYHDREGAGLNPVNEDYLRVLTDTAQAQGFKWIIGSDADEFLILRKHDSIQEFIKQFNHYNKVSLIFKWANYYPVNEALNNYYSIKKTEHPFFDCLDHRAAYMPWTKSIGKFCKGMYYIQGLHHIADKIYGQVSADLPGLNISPNLAYYAHFPYRSKSQFNEKNIGQAHKFGGWRLQKLKQDPDFFNKFWEMMLRDQSWPNNLDQDTKDFNKRFVYDPINFELMERIK